MMIRNNLLVFLVCLWLLLAVPMAMAQDDVEPEVTPTAEAETIPAPALPATQGGGNTFMDWVQFIIENDLHWYIFAFVMVLIAGNLVPQEEMKRRQEAAQRTETPVDDWFWTFLDLAQKLRPSLPAPSAPIPSPTLPSMPPGKPLGTTKYLAPYEIRLDMPGGRQIHVPINMGYWHKTIDGAGKEYPHPNVNVNATYGARFDIAHIAGVWGFTLLFTLDKDVKYKVTVDYSATVTGDKVSNLSDWLWWELLLGNEPTGTNIGISNGARHEASWIVEGTGAAVMITPCIHAQWASAGDMSVIEWHNLIITPIE